MITLAYYHLAHVHIHVYVQPDFILVLRNAYNKSRTHYFCILACAGCHLSPDIDDHALVTTAPQSNTSSTDQCRPEHHELAA